MAIMTKPYKIYKSDGVWVYLDILESGVPKCDAGTEEICSPLRVATAPVPEGCMVFEPDYDNVDWDQEYYEYQLVDCPDLGEKRSCTVEKKAGPGKYKVIYSYSEDCVDADLFEAKENNVQAIEREFQIV